MMTIKLITLSSLVAMASALSGCASISGAESHENVQQLKSGMSENQVLNLLGTPDSVVHQSKLSDRWIYEYKRDANKGHHLFVDFHQGELAKSGELNGRDVAAAEEGRQPGNCTKWQRPEFVENALCTQ